MSVYIVLLGPPGVGKGTQADMLVEKLGLPHISSGDIFRENIKNGTDMGKAAQIYIKKGELVPDDVTLAMIQNRLSRPDCGNGVILDGFPRTPVQADALAGLLKTLGGCVSLVPYITAPDEALIERLAGRWTCRSAGHIFNEKFNPPKKKGICDFDGSELYQREDDKTETILHRIAVYQNQTAPLIDYYKKNGVLVEINGLMPIEQVSAQLLSALKK